MQSCPRVVLIITRRINRKIKITIRILNKTTDDDADCDYDDGGDGGGVCVWREKCAFCHAGSLRACMGGVKSVRASCVLVWQSLVCDWCVRVGHHALRSRVCHLSPPGVLRPGPWGRIALRARQRWLSVQFCFRHHICVCAMHARLDNFHAISLARRVVLWCLRSATASCSACRWHVGTK